MGNAVFTDASGARQEIELDATLYREAADNSMSVPELLARKFPTDSAQYGSTFEQVMAGAGYFMRGDKALGITKAKIGDLLEPRSMSAGVVTREATPVSRIIFPAVIQETMENKLKEDAASDVAIFNSLVAINEDIDGDIYTRAVIDYSVPEAARSQPISQLAEPATMMTLTVSDISRTIPSFALSMTISEKAMKSATIDIVALSLARQAEVEQAKMIDGFINMLVAGDVDYGMSALTAVKANTFDSSITANGVISHKAWVKWLRNNSRRRTIDWIMCDADTYLALENRVGKPTVYNDDPTSPRFDALMSPKNLRVGAVNVFLLEPGVLPANTIVGIDSRYAIHKVRNLRAEYTGQENLVMRRGTSIRWDWSAMVYRFQDQAWDLLTLTI